jgi:putative transposase
MDFLHDQLYDGRKIRVLAIVDTFTRYSPAPDVRQAYKGADVVETLERACKEIGYPKMIRCDNGPEFVSRDLDLWTYQRDVTLDFSRPGKPTDNALAESFNGKFRVECLTRIGSWGSTMRGENARLGVETITNSDLTARTATNVRSS